MAHMGELEPPVLVVPSPLRTELISECVPIEVEYLQEDFIGEVFDCHGSDRGTVRPFGGNMKIS